MTVYTSYDALPDLEGGQIQTACCLPEIIMELMADNVAGQKDTTAFCGFDFWEPKKI